MVVHESKFIFIHIPKTGGTSIEKVFDNQATKRNVPYKHDTGLQYRENFPTEFETYFKFSFVRNPWDLVRSHYMYMWHSTYEWPQRWRLETKVPINYTFSDWIHSSQFKTSSPRTLSIENPKLSGTQLDWIVDEDGDVLVDFVGRFENLQNDFAFICSKIGLPPLMLTHENKSDHKPYWEFYDDTTRRIVEEKYQKDIQFFNYRFGE